MTEISGQKSSTAAAPLWAPGLVLGAVAAAAMTGPTLFPQNPGLRRLGFVGVAATFAGVGIGAEAIARRVDRHLPGDRLAAELAVGGTGAALAAGLAIASRGRVTGGRAMLQSAGMLVAAGGAAGVASTLVARADEHLPGPDALAQGGLATIAGGALLGVSMRNASIARSASYLLPDLPVLIDDVESFGTLAIERGREVRGALTSGSGPSAIAWEKMPGQGKRFLTEMPHAVDIERVMGVPAREPIRTFVGLKHDADAAMDAAGSIRRRIDIAIDDLDALGAFGRFEQLEDGTMRMLETPRRSILVPAPTVSGYVNPVAVSTHEFLGHGDTAAVTVQVNAKTMLGVPSGVGAATKTHAMLLERLKARLDQLPVGVRPSVKVYGESYGAWTSQNAMLGGSDDAATALSRLDDLGVDRAMYVGTPGYGRFMPKVTGIDGLVDGPDPMVRTVRDLADASSVTAEASANTRVTFLQHDADPVGLFHPKLVWERPEWLGAAATRPTGVSHRQRWMTLITGVQTAIDQQGAQLYKQGRFEAKGHDYRSEISYVMRRAYGAHDATDTQVARIREWNRQLEEIHAIQQQQRATVPAAGRTANP